MSPRRESDASEPRRPALAPIPVSPARRGNSAGPSAWRWSGRCSFSRLESHTFTAAFEHTALVVIGMFLATALLSLALPRTALAEEEVADL